MGVGGARTRVIVSLRNPKLTKYGGAQDRSHTSGILNRENLQRCCEPGLPEKGAFFG